jgi:3-deoxy-D-manno-octulosonic-acid transferase
VTGALHSIYNALWYPALPFALLRGGGSRPERLGRLAAARSGPGHSPRIWFHAASVGEVEAISGVATRLLDSLPGAGIVTTSMTSTGREAARKRIPRADACLFAPFDCQAVVRSFVSGIHPDLLVIAETELWPNYFSESRRAGARVAIVNGRISARALGRYMMLRPLFARTLEHADLVLAQTSADAARYRILGAPRRRVVVTGNTKFDLALAATPPTVRPALSRIGADRRLIVAGSTAPGEEEIIIEAWRIVSARKPSHTLVIAPRHLERAGDIARLLDSAGICFVRASMLDGSIGDLAKVILLDTMGDLRALYYRAAVAFVGGSMVAGRGGQSLAEPAAAEVPVLFGPWHENQRQMADSLTAGAGGRVVRNAGELAAAMEEMLGNDALRIAAGRAARRSLELLGGALDVSIPLLRSLVAQA